jgi:hypothetical protein
VLRRRECQSVPLERSSIFDLSRSNPPLELRPENGISPFDTSPSRPTAVIDDSVIERLAKGKLLSHRSAWGVGVSPPKVTVTRSNRDKCATFPRCPKSMAEREGFPTGLIRTPKPSKIRLAKRPVGYLCTNAVYHTAAYTASFFRGNSSAMRQSEFATAEARSGLRRSRQAGVRGGAEFAPARVPRHRYGSGADGFEPTNIALARARSGP